MAVMIRVFHRRDSRPDEDVCEHLVELLELGRHFLEQCAVVRVLSCGGGDNCRRGLDRARKIQYESLTTQPAFDHRFPVTDKTFVSAPSGPDVGSAFCLLLIAQQLRAIIRIAEPLHLQPQLVVETAEQERELILARIQMLGRGGT